jgi:uncharacterized protein (DUF2225 family)
MAEEKENGELQSATYFSKQKISCPLCGASVVREDLLTGSGRIIAGDLSDELRRYYEPSKKTGIVYPFLYSVEICPECGFAMMCSDFERVKKSEVEHIKPKIDKIVENTEKIFPYFKCEGKRDLFDGAAAYYIALQCYDLMSANFSPTIKKGIVCLRLAWICDELNNKIPQRNYDFIRDSFYRKSEFFYDLALTYETTGEEKINNIISYGPDTDKNYGFDGVQYLSALLTYKYGRREDLVERTRIIERKKTMLAKLFGLGKTSKSKPGPLLNLARDLYNNLKKELQNARSIDEEAFADLDLE